MHVRRTWDLLPDRIITCGSCGVVYASGTTPGFSYGEDYFEGDGKRTGYADYAGELESHRATFARRVREAERRLGRTGRLLDVGCALGHLAATACERGWDVYATDISMYAARRTRSETGAKVFVADPRGTPVAEGSMDLIALYDVLEHFPDPLTVLRQLAPVLRPDGLLHVTTPNVASLSAKLMGRYWYHYKAREHCVYFSPATLTRALNDSGFNVQSAGAASSRMSIDSILRRLERYAPSGARFARRLARRLGAANVMVSIPIGEFEAWARPRRTP